MFSKRKPLVTAESPGPSISPQQERALVTDLGKYPDGLLSQRLKGGSPEDSLPLPHPWGWEAAIATPRGPLCLEALSPAVTDGST